MNEVMKIKLEKNKGFTIVDADIYEKFKSYKWYLFGKPPRLTFYAIRFRFDENGKLKREYLHRLIMNAGKEIQVDHINGEGLDNRRENLRFATKLQNQMNKRPRRKASSIYKGICWHSRDKRWSVRICLNGKVHYLGYYYNEIKAAKAYDKAALEYFGEYARLNFPPEEV